MSVELHLSEYTAKYQQAMDNLSPIDKITFAIGAWLGFSLVVIAIGLYDMLYVSGELNYKNQPFIIFGGVSAMISVVFLLIVHGVVVIS